MPISLGSREWGCPKRGDAHVTATPHFRKKLTGERVQALGAVINGLFEWTSVSYDWSMVFKATSNQSEVTLVHPQDPRDRCAHSLYPFPL